MREYRGVGGQQEPAAARIFRIVFLRQRLPDRALVRELVSALAAELGAGRHLGSASRAESFLSQLPAALGAELGFALKRSPAVRTGGLYAFPPARLL